MPTHRREDLMRSEARTDVLCLLIIFCVNSYANCPSGWFGDQCKYRCKCENDACDATGECTGGQTCQGGWFGPACQYTDLAYKTPSDAEVVDGNENTCLTGANTQVTIKINESLPFTWLRAKVTNQGSAGLRYLTASFSNLGSNVSCIKQRKQLVDSTTLDIHCDLSNLTDQVILEGSAAAYLCSVYVNGGRNVALKEMAWQSSTYSFGGVDMTADKAVDGNTNAALSNKGCAHTHDITTNDGTSTWILSFSRPRRVHRYAIYNRGDTATARILGFTLESFDTLNKTTFAYKDTERIIRPIYRISHHPVDVGMIVISVNNTIRALTLCEVEVFGDSVCGSQNYGRECELDCQCPNSEACFVATGGCRLQCPLGLRGRNCSQPCDPGNFGPECELECNAGCKVDTCDLMTGICDTGCKSGFTGANCENICDPGWSRDNCSVPCSPGCQATADMSVSPCDYETGACIMGCKSGFGDNCKPCSSGCASSQCNETTGACLTGCKSGFFGDNCDSNSKCDVGKFGENCVSSCSPSCAPSDNITISPCNSETGACIKGCKSGYTGDDCAATLSTKTTTSDSNTGLIIGLCAAICALAFIAYFMCKKRTTRPKQEGASGRLPSAAEDTAQ